MVISSAVEEAHASYGAEEAMYIDDYQSDAMEEGEEHNTFYYYLPVEPMPRGIYAAIVEAVTMEPKYQPALTLPPVPRVSTNYQQGKLGTYFCTPSYFLLTHFKFVRLAERFSLFKRRN